MAELKRKSEQLEKLMSQIREIDRTACMDPFGSMMNAKEQLNDFLQEMSNASFFQKRKIKKEIQATSLSLQKSTKNLKKCVFHALQDLWIALNEMIREIAVVVPDVTTGIQKFQMPHGPAAKNLLDFGADFSQFYLDLIQRFRDEAVSALEKNKDIVNRYSKYITLDQASIETTERTTAEAIGIMAIREVLDLLHTLRKETKSIRSARRGVEEKIQMAIVNQATGLIELLETCDSIGIDYESTLDLRTQATWVVEQAHGTESVDQLFELEKRITSLGKDFVSTLRAKNFSIKSETEKEVSRFSAILQGRDVDDLLPKPPDVDMGSSDALELIRSIETMRTWQRKTLFGMKRVVNANELQTVIKTARSMKIEIPSEMDAKIRNIADKIERLEDLGESVTAIREYLDIQASLTDIMRSHILRNIDSDEYRIVSAILEPPTFSLETNEAKAMLSQLRESERWLSDVIERLRDTSKDIGDTLIHIEEAEAFSVSFPPDIRPSLQRIRNKIITEEDLGNLTGLWKEYQEDLEKIRLAIYLFIKKSLESPSVRQLTTNIREIQTPFDDIERKDLQRQLAALRGLKRWKDQVLSQLHQQLVDETLPSIPADNPYDLREYKKGVVQSLEKGTAVEDFEVCIQGFFDYLEKKTKTRERLAEEIGSILVKNKDLIEKARRSLGRASSGLSINLTYDDSMAYEDALQMWWDLQRLISNKIDRLTDISISNLYSMAEDYRNIPDPWVSYFDSLFEFAEKQSNDFQKIDNMEEVLRKYDFVVREFRTQAIEGVEKMRGKMHTSLSVTISQIGEIIQIPDEIRNSVEWIRDMSPELETSEQVARIVRELIHNFENEILAPLTEILMNESAMVLKYINDLKTVGIDVLQYVADNVKKSSELLTQGETVTIRDIAEVFSLLADIKYNPTVGRVIREHGKQEIEAVRKAAELTGTLFGPEIEVRIKDLAGNLVHPEQALMADDLGVLCQQYLYITQVASAVLQTMVSLEAEEFQNTQARLLQSLQYYPSINAVFDKYSEPTSKAIYPYSTLLKRRDQFAATSSVGNAATLLTEIYDLRLKWENEVTPTLNRWHKALRMFISMVQPTYNRDENRRQLEEIRKRINGTYSHRPIQTYLYYAVRHYVEQMPMEEEEEEAET
ncbi:MAG: hypothetical protein ACE5OZ_19205 [Candidatus Heimdallarchaeota archaeon]